MTIKSIRDFPELRRQRGCLDRRRQKRSRRRQVQRRRRHQVRRDADHQRRHLRRHDDRQAQRSGRFHAGQAQDPRQHGPRHEAPGVSETRKFNAS